MEQRHTIGQVHDRRRMIWSIWSIGLAGLVLLLPASSTSRPRGRAAGGAHSRPGAWLTKRRASDLVARALEKCTKLEIDDMPQEYDPRTDDGMSVLEARRRGGRLELIHKAFGNGIDGTDSYFYWLLDDKRCQAIGLEYASGMSSSAWKFTAYGRGPPTAAEQAALVALSGMVFARPGSPDCGAARLVMSPPRCDPLDGKGWTLCGAAQPAFGGQPLASARALWTGKQLVEIGALEDAKQAGSKQAQAKKASKLEVSPPVSRPRPVRREGQYQIFATPMAGRESSLA